MNFNYSYRAFLITSLLVGNLILLLLSVELNKKVEVEEEVLAIEYALEELEEEVAPEATAKVKIETNTAYNEAEKFISELENSRNNEEEILEENNETPSLEEEHIFKSDYALNDEQNQLNSVKKRLADHAKKNKKLRVGASSNKKTTISYRLKDRSALLLRNPVYTCNKGGKIVINIEVNALGKVVKTSYNKTASTTTNGCLIDSALEYANKAKFNTNAKISKQLGTITYTFPGQS